jgi:hypothetical protein
MRGVLHMAGIMTDWKIIWTARSIRSNRSKGHDTNGQFAN